jgi:3-hydroxy-D-aspartate aldolase
MNAIDDLRLHSALIGREGSRCELNTPVLVIDRDPLERNIARMADFARASGVALRPHAKTHKSLDIARLQIAAGAVGVCCAKLGEAEALADGGIEQMLITSPVVSAPAMARLAALNRRVAVKVVVDNPANVLTLSKVIGNERLEVIIDVDPGIRRTGVTTPEIALALCKLIRGTSNLSFAGIQFYCGLQQHIPAYTTRREVMEERVRYLRSIIELLSRNDCAPAIVTGSGTGTHCIDAALGVFTEWQVGSYVFMDRQYAECDLKGDGSTAYEHSLFVDARVVSCNTPGMATIDAGFKALSTDAGPPVVAWGAPARSTYHFMGDEHGAIVDPAQAKQWSIGELVRLIIPHCDPTVNLYDAYHVVRGETLVDIWPVTARGRSR